MFYPHQGRDKSITRFSAAFALGAALSMMMPLSAYAADGPKKVEETSSPARQTNSPTGAMVGPAKRPVGVSVEEADDEQRRKAQEAFASGDQAYDVQDYEKALKSFEISHSVVASPNSRLMIARVLLELGRLDEAFEEYDGVIKDAGDSEDYKNTADTAGKEQDALRSRLAWVTIEWVGLVEGATLEVAGRRRDLGEAEQAIAVVPGKTQIIAVSPSGDKAGAIVHLAAGRSADVNLKAGETLTVGTAPVREKEQPSKEAVTPGNEEGSDAIQKSPRSLLPYAYVAAGIGIVGFGTFATFGVLSGNNYQALEEDCADGSCPPESQDNIDAGKTQQLIANVGLAVGIAGLGTGVVLYLLDMKRRGPVHVDVGYRSVVLRGEF